MTINVTWSELSALVKGNSQIGKDVRRNAYRALRDERAELAIRELDAGRMPEFIPAPPVPT